MPRFALLALLLFGGGKAVASPYPADTLRFLQVAHEGLADLPDSIRALIPTQVQGEEELERLATLVGSELRMYGWIEASADSAARVESHYTLFWHLGPRYLVDGRRPARLDPEADARRYLANTDSLAPTSLVRVRYLPATGNSAALHPLIETIPGEHPLLLDLVPHGTLRLRPRVLARLAGMRRGETLNVADSLRLQHSLRGLEYARMVAPPRYEYTPRGVRLHLYMDRIASSEVEGGLGYSPDASKGGLQGEARLRLVNLFRHAELIEGAWRSPGNGEHTLNARFRIDYLGGSGFGMAGQAAWRRQDSVASHVALRFALRYATWRGGTYSAALTYRTVTDTTLGGLSLGGWGGLLAYEYARMDMSTPWPFGCQATLEIGLARRGPKGSLFEASADSYLHYPLRFWNLSMSFRALYGVEAPLWGGDALRPVELLRIGGVGSLRGFHEGGLRTTHYALGMWEWRWVGSPWVMPTLFADGGWVGGPPQALWALGLGGGAQVAATPVHLQVYAGRAWTWPNANHGKWMIHLRAFLRF